MIYAIRHFITPWNAKGLLQGRSDISLDLNNDQNKNLAISVSNKLNEITFDQVLVSPLKRAIETAQLLNISSYTIDPIIGEMSFGNYEGQPKQKMLQDFHGQWEAAPLETTLKPELIELQNRIIEFVENANPRSNTLIISHGAYIRGLRAYVETGSIDTMNQMEVKNGDLIAINL